MDSECPGLGEKQSRHPGGHKNPPLQRVAQEDVGAAKEALLLVWELTGRYSTNSENVTSARQAAGNPTKREIARWKREDPEFAARFDELESTINKGYPTGRQKLFALEYIARADLDAVKAVIAAGYTPSSANQTAYELMRNSVVVAEIKKVMGERAERTKKDADWVIERLGHLADFDITRLFQWDAEGNVTLTPSVQLSEADSYAISEIVKSEDGTLKFKIEGKQNPLKLIGEHNNLWPKKVDMTIEQTVLTAEEARAKMQEIADRARQRAEDGG